MQKSRTQQLFPVSLPNVSQGFCHCVEPAVLWGNFFQDIASARNHFPFPGNWPFLDSQRWLPGELHACKLAMTALEEEGTYHKLGQLEPFLHDFVVGMIREF